MTDYKTDYMTLHASAYPPPTWTYLRLGQPKTSQTCPSKFRVELTNQYEQSMAKRQHLFTSNHLSKTATKDNISKMSSAVKERYDRRRTIALQDTAEVGEILEVVGEHMKALEQLSENPMETIPEDQSDKIERSFKNRLTQIFSFIRIPIGNRLRPTWACICCLDRKVGAHVALVQQQLTSDVAQLREFLRGRLFDEYCLMRGTPQEEKDRTWMEYGKCILGYQHSETQIGQRLDRMIDASGLDPNWVMNHIEDNYYGNDHIGQWQRYMQDRRWMDLAEKFITDIQQLKKINSTRSNNTRRCNIMLNIVNSKRQFFKRLDGVQDYELSEKALRMEEEGYESSSTSSSDSSSTS